MLLPLHTHRPFGRHGIGGMIEIIRIKAIIHYCADKPALAVLRVRDFEGTGAIGPVDKPTILGKDKRERGPFRDPVKQRVRIAVRPPIGTGSPGRPLAVNANRPTRIEKDRADIGQPRGIQFLLSKKDFRRWAQEVCDVEIGRVGFKRLFCRHLSLSLLRQLFVALDQNVKFSLRCFSRAII